MILSAMKINHVSEDDVCSSESDYIPSEDGTESDNDEIITRKKKLSLRQLSKQPPNKIRKTTAQSRSVTPISDSASTDVVNGSNELSTSLSSSSASQDTADSSTQRDLPPILSFNRKCLRDRNGHHWSTESRSSIVGRPVADNIMTSCTPGPIFPSSFSGDTHVDYLKLLLDHSMTKEIDKKQMPESELSAIV